VMRKDFKVALITISEANYMPVVLSYSFRQASLANPRSPQWKSRAGHLNRSRPINERLGLPIQRFFQGISPGAITPPPPRSRQPITRSNPSPSFSTKR